MKKTHGYIWLLGAIVVLVRVLLNIFNVWYFCESQHSGFILAIVSITLGSIAYESTSRFFNYIKVFSFITLVFGIVVTFVPGHQILSITSVVLSLILAFLCVVVLERNAKAKRNSYNKNSKF